MRGLAEYERLEHTFAVTPERLAEHLFGARPYVEALIAEAAGRPAGYALFFPTYSTFLGQPGLYLEDLFVLPEQRGAGLGKRLLAEVAAIAARRGCARLEWAVLDWNRPAIDFYERLGARRNESWLTCRLDGEALQRLADSI
ncbi:MAG TPA: GNAT family N-acetyltransferase [Candidatus Dormibacteraeota bacterium]